MSNSRAEDLRKLVTGATGIAGEKIFVGATHDHSALALGSGTAGKKYYQEMLLWGLQAAEEAIADRAPAAALATTTHVPGMNFIRHYLMNDGTYAGSSFGSYSTGIKDYARETDDRMILVKFDREGDKKDVLMVNWAAHPDYGMSGVYQARGILNRYKMDETIDLELNSFRIGQMAFFTGTYEMFSTTGKYTRKHSPFEQNFIITGCSSYIPCAEAYDYNSYEAVSAYYARGTAEKLGEQYVKMLNDIK